MRMLINVQRRLAQTMAMNLEMIVIDRQESMRRMRLKMPVQREPLYEYKGNDQCDIEERSIHAIACKGLHNVPPRASVGECATLTHSQKVYIRARLLWQLLHADKADAQCGYKSRYREI